MQEGRIIAWEADKRYRPEAGRGWVHYMLTPLRRRLPYKLRQLRTHGLTGAPGRLPATRQPTDEAIGPVDETDSLAEQTLTERVVANLEKQMPDDLFRILSLYYGLDGGKPMTVRAIAKQLRLPRQSLQNKLNRARQLARQLGQK